MPHGGAARDPDAPDAGDDDAGVVEVIHQLGVGTGGRTPRGTPQPTRSPRTRRRGPGSIDTTSVVDAGDSTATAGGLPAVPEGPPMASSPVRVIRRTLASRRQLAGAGEDGATREALAEQESDMLRDIIAPAGAGSGSEARPRREPPRRRVVPKTRGGAVATAAGASGRGAAPAARDVGTRVGSVTDPTDAGGDSESALDSLPSGVGLPTGPAGAPAPASPAPPRAEAGTMLRTPPFRAGSNSRLSALPPIRSPASARGGLPEISPRPLVVPPSGAPRGAARPSPGGDDDAPLDISSMLDGPGATSPQRPAVRRGGGGGGGGGGSRVAALPPVAGAGSRYRAAASPPAAGAGDGDGEP